jgi:uncharacterized protein (TIGR00251 family)
MAEREQAKLVVRVQANARQSQLTGFKDGVLHVRVSAPPVEGKANEALVKFLSAQLGVSKSQLKIEKGLTSKTKTVIISGMSEGEVLLRFLNLSV